MLDRLDAALAKAGRKRGKDFEIIVTPPVTMADGNVPKYAELGVGQHLGAIDELVTMARDVIPSAAKDLSRCLKGLSAFGLGMTTPLDATEPDQAPPPGSQPGRQLLSGVGSATRLVEDRLLVLLHYIRQVRQPDLRRAEPVLIARDELVALANGADTQHDHRGVPADRSGVDRRAAGRAERLLASVAALGRLHVDRGSAGKKRKRARLRQHHRAEGGARKGLAVRAMANNYCGGVDLRLESDAAAMTAAFDLHGFFPQIPLPPVKGRGA